MANGVNVKMGVSGVAQFKQAMKQAQTSVKTLDAELALNEKQFKASGDAETYMEQKTELLRKKLEEQKTAVSNAEKALEEMNKNGVDKASTAYQNMQQALANAKSNLIDTQTQIDNVGTAATDAEVQVDGMNQALASVDKGVAWQNVTDGIQTLTDGMGDLIRKAYELGAALVRNTLGAGAWADELNTTATKYGISAEELQRMRKTATIIDTDTDTILDAKDRMNKNLSSSGDMLELLGIGNIVSTDVDDNFWSIGEAIMNMGDAQTQAEAAQKIFGRSWRELVPLFTAGREEYEKLNDSWNVVPEKSLEALQKMDDQYQKLQAEIETVKMQFLSELSPAVTSVMETLTGLVEEFNKYIQSEDGKEMMDSLSEAVSSLFSDLASVDPKQVVENVISAIDNIKNALKWIKDNKDGIVTAVEAFVGAWAIGKLISVATNIGKIVDGFQTLWSGANKKLPSVPGTGSGSGVPTSSHPTASQGISVGSMFSSAGGMSVVAPLAALVAAGVAGAEMIKANLNDVSLNQIYGDSEGKNLLDRMTPEQLALAKKYEALYGNTGSEEAMDARDALYKALEEGGIELPEQAVSLLENIFEERLNEVDIDGLVAKFDRIAADMDGGTSTGGGNYWNTLPERYASLITDKVAAAITEAMEGISVQMDGQEVGAVVSPYVNAGWGGLVVKMTK